MGLLSKKVIGWGTPEEKETKRRIQIAAAAYAYEVLDNPIWSDAEFDKKARYINLNQKTGNKKMDKWFKENFKPTTGAWVNNHPDKAGLKRIVKLMRKKQ